MNFFKKKYLIIFAFIIIIPILFYFYNKKISKKDNFQIINYKKEYKERVLEILKENFYWIIDGHTWEELNFGKQLDEMKTKEGPDEKDSHEFDLLVIKDKNNNICGFINYYIYSEKNDQNKVENKYIGRIHLLSIDKKYQRMGLAKKLTQSALKNLFENDKNKNIEIVWLITRNNNLRAQNLYSKLNFNLYDDGKKEGNNFYVYVIDKNTYFESKII